MTETKIIIGHKGKSYQKAITEELVGKKIRDKFSGDIVGLNGYEFEITGGSDTSGFPMRNDVIGVTKKAVLLTKGPGVHVKNKGDRIRKTVRGNTISAETSQINLKVLKVGSEELDKIFVKKEEDKPLEKA